MPAFSPYITLDSVFRTAAGGVCDETFAHVRDLRGASGTQSHVTLTTGNDEHNFTNYPNFFHINRGDQMVTYALVDPCNPPAEMMVQFKMCCDGWNHRMFWGQDLLKYDMLGKDRIDMGPVPAGGQWVRLTAPASRLQLGGSANGQDIFGLAFNVAGGGHVWFDRTGRESCSVPVAPSPSSYPPGDIVWFDDATPAGASLHGTWNWDTTQKASGTKAHHEPDTLAFHQHYFDYATQTIRPGVGDKLVVYALLDACAPPNEIYLQWFDGSTWNHRAYWGPNLQNCGAEGPACHSMGALPASGSWVRLEVPASAVGAEGLTLSGMAFGLWSGHAWFDRAGVAPAGGGTLRAQPREEARFESLVHRIASRWRHETSSLGFGASARFAAQPAAIGPTRSYSFYTPELQLLSETTLTDAATPPMAYDYVWFNGQPLAQVNNATGEVSYDFNDHLGAPILQTDSGGSVVWQVERDPYGGRYLARAGADRHQPLGLPGQEFSENATELRYNIFRFYRPGWSRYSQSDAAGLASGINLFSYVGGNPLSRLDPRGLCLVELRFSPLGAGLYYHAYITTTDNSGTMYFRGGPSGSGGSSGTGSSSASGGSSTGSCCRSRGSGSSNSTSPGASPGASSSSNGPYGSVHGMSGEYGPDTPDYPKGSEQQQVITLLDDGSPCDCNNCFQKALDEINRANVAYNPFTTNSNALAHALLQRCGFNASPPPYWSPGWSTPLP